MHRWIKGPIRSLFHAFGLEVERTSKSLSSDTRTGLNILYMFANALSGRLDRPIQIVQIGANNGEDEDSVARILGDFSCKAVLVEPHPQASEALRERYKGYDNVAVDQRPISQDGATLKFYMSSAPSQSNISSVDRDHVEKFVSSYNSKLAEGATPAEVVALTLESISVQQLLTDHGVDYLDILAVDAEGLDYEIVSSVLDNGLEVGSIFFEFICMGRREFDELISRLESEGYFLARSGFDVLAVKKFVIEESLPGLMPG